MILAYTGAVFGGRMLLPLLRPLFRLPDLFISIIAGAIVAFAIYAVVNLLGALLFKRTGQQPAGFVRFLYGLCGAFLGIFFGLSHHLARDCGDSAHSARSPNAQLRSQTSNRAQFPSHQTTPPNDSNPLINSLARLNNSIELRPGWQSRHRRAMSCRHQTYQTLGKLGTGRFNPRRAPSVS